MISSIISRLVILVFGTLYPAYASYKAVRTKNVKEYVKWMMYWIVFALFTCAETFTDVFCSFWFPFYYETKVILVLWLLSPATKGSSILYRKFVHPMLTKREQEIDEYIAKAKEQGYHTVLTLGSKGVNYATTVIMQTAIKGGGGLVNQLRRSYSLSDISADMDALAEMNRIKALPEDELDIADTPLPKDARLRRSRGFSPRRSASGSGRVEMYFPEVDVNVRQRGTRPRETGIPLSHIRSNEDVSSGYSSAEMLYSGHPPASEAQEALVRTSSVGSSRVTRTKVARGGATPKRPTAAEDNLSRSESEESDSGTQEHFYDVTSASHSEPVETPPSATISQSVPSHLAGSDFKSHLPVALEDQPKDKLVLPPEENVNYTNDTQNVTSNCTVGLLEDQSTVVSFHSNQKEERKQVIPEPVQGEKANLEQGKSPDGEFNTYTDNSELISDIVKDCQSFEKEISSSVSEVPYLEVLKNNEDTKMLDINALSPTVNCGELVIESSTDTNTFLPQGLDDIEFFDTESDMTQNTMAGHNGSLPTGLQIYNSLSVSEDDKDSSNVSKTNEHLDPYLSNLIPTAINCKEVETAESVMKNIPQEHEDNEFFDTETDLSQNPNALSDNINILPAMSECLPLNMNEPQNEDKIAENNVQISIDEVPKEGRAGRYNKRPAPSPPPKASTEDFQLITHKDGPECKSNVRQELDSNAAASLSPKAGPEELQLITHKGGPECGSNVRQELVPDLASSLPPKTSTEDLQLITHKGDPECGSNVRQELVPDLASSLPPKISTEDLQLITHKGDPECGSNVRQELVPDLASSLPTKASTEDLQLITHKDDPECENNIRQELVPNQMPPSSTREKSRSKSPQCSPHVNEMNTANGKSEHNTNVTIEQMAPKEKINNYNPVTASFTETQDMRPSEYYYNQYRAQASPKQSKKETKPKQEARFFSRILSKPRSQLASFFPFFSSPVESQPLSDALTTSLTSLDDMRAQERVRSSSIAGTMPSTSDYMSPPPAVPPRRRTPEQSGECGTRVNIREMSHSPARH